jgi:mannose-6-phosphate isomerase-like protein (cupin superfamily)
VHLKYDARMKLALIAMLPLALSMPLQAQRKPAPAPVTTATTVTVTDLSGAPLGDVRVTLTGLLERSGSTHSNGIVKFDGMRPGTYRLRFDKEGFVLLEREIEVRAKQAPPDISVALSRAPEPAAPAAPPAPEAPPLPPAGKAVTVNLPDFIERNLITGSQPQKVSPISCSGTATTLLWQVREPWPNRLHERSDALLYVVAGEGTLRLGSADVPVVAGSFTQVPRGTTYSISRRGRNPVILLATLIGDACE